MTHNEKRQSAVKEGLIGLGVGVLYGVTNVCAGHPFDTIKTKMQAQTGFENQGMFKSFIRTLKADGIRGLYRYTYCNDVGKTQIPLTGGIQIRVLLGGLAASTARAVIETPLELAKVRRQTGQTWHFRGLYKGFGVTWCRTVGLMCTYFILVDTFRRNMSDQFKKPILGPFLVSGVAATLGWWVVWPLEYMKSQVQGNYGKDMSTWKRMSLVIRERGGFFGLYRGIVPGSIRSFLANGCAMIVMSYAQRKVSELGLRG